MLQANEDVMVDTKQLISDAFDAITTVSHCSLEIGNRRRAIVRNSFDPEVRDICNASIAQFDTSLFEEEFYKTVKDAKETARINHIAERPKQENTTTRHGGRASQQSNTFSALQRSHFLGVTATWVLALPDIAEKVRIYCSK